MFVTTSTEPTAEQIDRARELAAQFRTNYFPRKKNSIPKMMQQTRCKACIIVERKELRYIASGQKPLFFHPSSGLLRVKRLAKGENDGLTDIAMIKPGDRILDATCGFGSDSLVMQFACGLSGQVVALESSDILATIVGDGLKRYAQVDDKYVKYIRKIQLVHTEYQRYLKTCPDKSFDVVYFDPMFSQAISDSTHLEPLRDLANHEPLSLETVEEACRVARRCVILKDHATSPFFERLGFEAQVRRWTAVRYGRILLNEYTMEGRQG